MTAGQRQRDQDGLQQQSGRTGRADLETISPGLRSRMRLEEQLLAVLLGALDAGAAYGGGGLDGRNMLWPQAGCFRPALMLITAADRPKIADRLRAVRRTCPPPSPVLPSIINGFIGIL